MTKLTLHIEGMSCGHCLNAVRKAITEHPGLEVSSVRIGRADLEFDPARTTPEAVVASVRAAGYEATARLDQSEAP
jgi:copper chaperone CopZ